MNHLTNLQFCTILFLLIAPTLYQRAKFELDPDSFKGTWLRDKLGINLHHGHFGLPLLFLGWAMLVNGWWNDWSVCISALGWGFILDEIVPMLMMETPDKRKKDPDKEPFDGRTYELDVYYRSKMPTLILVASVVVVITLLFKLL